MKMGFLLLSILLGSCITANASSTLTLEQTKIIENAIQKVVPNITVLNSKIELIKPDLYKITSDAEVFYVSKDGGYFFYGELIDLNEPNKKQWNLTDKAKRTIRTTELSKISKKDMLIFKSKKRNHGLSKSIGSVTVFADVSCPHSKRLHKEIEEAVSAGLEVRYLFFPRAGIGSDSYKKAVSIWCSKNRNKEFSMANNDETIPERTCKNNPIETQFNFGKKIGINATPSIVLENGTLIPGFVTSDNLLRIVKEANASSSS